MRSLSQRRYEAPRLRQAAAEVADTIIGRVPPPGDYFAIARLVSVAVVPNALA